VEQLQPNDHDDGDKENVPYCDQLTEQAGKTSIERSKARKKTRLAEKNTMQY
jgi:hypothetical protein